MSRSLAHINLASLVALAMVSDSLGPQAVQQLTSNAQNNAAGARRYRSTLQPGEKPPMNGKREVERRLRQAARQAAKVAK